MSDEAPTKKRTVLGWICTIWGGLIVLNGIPVILNPPETAYGAGRYVAVVFGAFLAFAGIRELRKKVAPLARDASVPPR